LLFGINEEITKTVEEDKKKHIQRYVQISKYQLGFFTCLVQADE
jgi:hypothetical protein